MGIDVDHLIIARKNNEDWQVLRRCISKPKAVLLAQNSLITPSDVPQTERLVSHVIITTALSITLLLVNSHLAIVTLIVLSVHIGCDVIADEFPECPFSPGPE